ncbi:MAG: SDR family oxidoreductase [Planctomycetales bacterium]|nr:SDR family oxidoreductase [Planctomycetales bacterium]
MARFLVTGGAGFIGSHVVEYLLRLREQVVVLDDLSSGRRENLAPLGERVQVVLGDVRDPAACAEAVRGADFVLHLAALTSVPRSVAEPAATFDVNATGTLRVLEAARAAKAKRVVLASSSSVYGDSAVSPKVETLPPNPLSPYAASKLAAEGLAQAWARSLGVPTIALRFFNVFGPRQDPKSQYAAVVPRFVTAMLSGGTPIVYGDGKQTRDFTYVENAVQALVLAVRQGVPGSVYNVAGGKATTVLDLLGMIAKAAGAKARAERQPARPGDILHSHADVAKARKELGFAPSVDVAEGIRRTVEWYRRETRPGVAPAGPATVAGPSAMAGPGGPQPTIEG